MTISKSRRRLLWLQFCYSKALQYELAHHLAMRLRQARQYENAARVYLSARTRHGDFGSYPRPGFSNRSTGAKAAVPAVRITTGAIIFKVPKRPMADAS
jgi:hypothetical protein